MVKEVAVTRRVESFMLCVKEAVIVAKKSSRLSLSRIQSSCCAGGGMRKSEEE